MSAPPNEDAITDVLDSIRTHGPMRLCDLVRDTGRTETSVRCALARLQARELVRVRGRYRRRKPWRGVVFDAIEPGA
jgi:DNA-binding IclR family transcriptional regulator